MGGSLRAQTIHHDYRARQSAGTEPANSPGVTLRETFREANRELAKRYAAHLASTEGFKKTTRYRWEFRPDRFTQSDPVLPFLFRFSEQELESPAGREHTLWKEERERAGWRYGPVRDAERKTNPLLVDYSQWTDEADRERNREFVRRIPLILALADSGIVEAT